MTKESKHQNWFDVDRTGLRKLLEDRGIEFALFELIQNAWDEAGVTRVEITLKPALQRGKGFAWLIVKDDAPHGFADLRHAYTLFAESAKKANAEQRGRFNIGEKLVLSLCNSATIKTTKGTVFFDIDGTRSEGSGRTKQGSEIEMLIKISEKDIDVISHEVHKLIPPRDIKTIFNGVEIALRDREHQIEATLPTVIGDDQGVLRRTKRKTMIYCFEPRAGETAMIYEMGIPIVEHNCAFHCDIQQKVPLTLDRKNVTDKFLRYLQVAVLDATHEKLTTEDINQPWAQIGAELTDKPEVVETYMTKKFGELRVSYDMSDREANNRAIAAGYTVVHGSQMSGALWENAKEFETIKPAGQLFPTHSGEFVEFEPADVDDNMRAVAAYTKELGVLLLGCSIKVAFGEQGSNEAACWSDRKIQYNVKNLGRSFFRLHENRLAIDDLIIHEFGHHYASNHLSNDYYDALTRLAAKAMQLGREGRLPR